MELPFMERIRQGLQETRESISAWLQTTPLEKKAVHLGPSTETAVRRRLEAIDRTLAEAGTGTLGKCRVCHGDVEPGLLEIDYTACVCIEHFSEAERQQLQNELELAQNIQKMLLPQEPPRIPGLEIAAYSRPSQIVGGDYFDFVRFASGADGLIIADVAGHGVSSSLIVASVQALLRTVAPTSTSPADVIRQIHKLLIHNIRYSTFVSFFIGAYDASTRTLAFCNAGHPPQLVIRNSGPSGGSPELLRPTGAAIGLVETADFGETTIRLHAGDTLVLYTDGVTEAVNGRKEMFGRERLAALVRQVEPQTARGLVQRIRQSLETFCEGRPLADDTTIVVGRLL